MHETKKNSQQGNVYINIILVFVVITIISLLAAIFMPAFSHARNQAKIAVCKTNLMQIAMSVMLYADENQGSFPDTIESTVDIYLDGEMDILYCPSVRTEPKEISYIYRGDDLDSSVSAMMIVAYDKYDNHNGDMRNVLFADTHVKEMVEEEFLEAIAIDNEKRRQMGLKQKDVPDAGEILYD